jgi:hypothetical protein
MTWDKVRADFRAQWVVVEALNAYTQNGKRLLSELVVEGSSNDWQVAWAKYKDLHHADKFKEYYVLHTSNEHLDIGVMDAFGRVIDTSLALLDTLKALPDAFESNTQLSEDNVLAMIQEEVDEVRSEIYKKRFAV